MRGAVFAMMTVAAGCSDAPGGPSGPHRLYQVTSEDLASANAVELDGTKVADKLGQAFELVKGERFGDPQLVTDQALATGSLSFVVDVQGTGSSAKNAPALVNSYAGGAVAYDPTSPAQPALAGTADGLLVTAGPGDFTLKIQPFAIPVPVVLHGANVQLVAGGEKLQAVLAGGVDMSFVNDTLIPSWQLTLAEIVAHDCSTRTPPGCGCTANSAGASALNLFDQTPRDCVITSEEIVNSSLVQCVARPDLTVGDQRMLSFAVGIAADFVTEKL